jgi:hypothetical protein
MNNDQINSLVRSLLKILGSLLIAHGYSTYANIINTPDVIGFIIALAAFISSHFAHSTPASNPPRPTSGPLLVLFIALALGCPGSVSAQTNLTAVPNQIPAASPLSQILSSFGISSNPTNYAGALFLGHSLKGGQTALGAVVIENVSDYAGVIVGVDTLFGGGKVGSANIVSGGLTLKLPTHPLAFIGGSFCTNLLMTPYAIAMVGTPISGTGNADGGLASITREGVNFDIYDLKGFELGAGIDYGTRSGAGNYNGNWIDFEFSIRKGF